MGKSKYAVPPDFDKLRAGMVGALGNSVKTMSKLMVPLILLATADNHEAHTDAMEFYRASHFETRGCPWSQR